MRATTACLAKGFWGRSIDEFKRLSNIAIKLEGIKGPSGPMPLHSFHTSDSIGDCKVMSDVDIGGSSQASLDWVPPDNATSATATTSSTSGSTTNPNHHPITTTTTTSVKTPAPPPSFGYARFHGNISTALPAHKPDVVRTGYAAWRTSDRPPTLFGKALWDVDMYTYLALRVRSDGRRYLVNVQTESVVPTDLHQHRLFTVRPPGEWETVLIRWNDFVRTSAGFVVEPQGEMLRRKVRSVGLGLTDRVPGPFELHVERVWATNDASEADADRPLDDLPALGEGQLRNRQGQNIHWK
ncbi:complex I intermediate-associated protein 30-domain-containing protein [Xylariaceae sp. FL0804]|nr:complex I intermediate-associated protein 30-domain-containing protein [Xylariaceae sp. FL0804]